MAATREILVSEPHADGTAGVWRDARGDCWLTGSLEGGGGTLIDEIGKPRIEGVELDLTIQGGLLPPGATAAVIVDDAGREHNAAIGEGAWVVVLAQRSFRSSPVRFTDESGTLVRPSLPPDWPSQPVPDADTPCPACGAAQWEKVTPLDTESRGARSTPDGGWEPTPIVVCAACGHEESTPSFYGVEADEGWEVSDEPPPGFSEPKLADVGFPVYGLADHEPRLGGWGMKGSATTEVSVEHGRLDGDAWAQVTTELEDHPMDSETATARRALETSLHDAEAEDWPAGLSDSALTLRLHDVERARRRAASVPAESHQITVDGVVREFQLVRSASRWGAAARIADDMLLTIAARGIDPSGVSLVRVPDPAGLPSVD